MITVSVRLRGRTDRRQTEVEAWIRENVKGCGIYPASITILLDEQTVDVPRFLEQLRKQKYVMSAEVV